MLVQDTLTLTGNDTVTLGMLVLMLAVLHSRLIQIWMEISSCKILSLHNTAATNPSTATVSQVSTDQTKDGVAQSTEVTGGKSVIQGE